MTSRYRNELGMINWMSVCGNCRAPSGASPVRGPERPGADNSALNVAPACGTLAAVLPAALRLVPVLEASDCQDSSLPSEQRIASRGKDRVGLRRRKELGNAH